MSDEVIKTLLWCGVFTLAIREIADYAKAQLFVTGKRLFQPRTEQPEDERRIHTGNFR